MTRRFGAKDPVAIRIFYPYAYPADSAEATEYQRYIGRTNELSLIFHSETVVELRAHDEVKQGGYPISAAGVAGTDGVDGTNGLDGAPGMSAYQLAVSQGFVGTMTDWLLSLIGPQGPAGVDGTNGVDGADGEMPVPVWNGTELEWQDSAGTQLAAPADLVGPQGPIGPAGADGSQVNFATNADGTLTYSFVESVKASYPFWSIRLLGGVLFLSGMFIMFYNMVKTIAGQKAYEAPVVVPAAAHA